MAYQGFIGVQFNIKQDPTTGIVILKCVVTRISHGQSTAFATFVEGLSRQTLCM
jgi:hypothetical protein